MLRPALCLVPFFVLAACSGPEGNITIHDKDGNVAITTDASGRTRIQAPGVDIEAKLPKIEIDAADFDINGVKLYPGSKITNTNIVAGEESAGPGKDRVSLDFDAPAAPATVRAWYQEAMTKKGFKVAVSGDGLAGTTDEGQPVTLELKADGADKSKGKLSIGA